MRARWLARAAFALSCLGRGLDRCRGAGLAMVAVGAIAVGLIAAGGYWFLGHRGVLRWLVRPGDLGPSRRVVVFARHDLIWVAVGSAVLLVLASGAARPALTLVLAPAAAGQGVAIREVPPPRRAFLIMKPRSGGGKVAKSG